MQSTAIVLLNYNGLELLKKFLPHAIKNIKNASIFIIDNGSTDSSISWVKNTHSEIECIILERNKGFAGGYNEGLKQIKAEIYALVNTDLELTPNWLPPLLSRFESNPQTVVVQPHILDYNRRNKFEYAGAAGGYIDALGIPFCRGRLINNCETDNGQYNQTAQIFWASGACFLIRSKTFWEMRGFDSNFFAHQEEIDLCWRIFNAGYLIESIGLSKVFHVGGGTLKFSSRKIYLNHRNSLLMCAKNLPRNKLYTILLKKLLLDGLISIAYILKFNFKATYAIIRAHFSFYKMFKTIYLLRKDKKQNAKYFLRKNIFVDYFIFRRLNFRDLDKNYK
jgi:GT2 family glycosyltransferase